MEIFRQLNKFTKTLLIAGLFFLLYGYLCRIAGIYFFWESKTIGWNLLLIGVIGFLLNKIKIKKGQKDKAVGEKIGIGLIVFGLFVQTILMIIIPSTDAYAAAIKYLTHDPDLKAEIGNVKGFGVIPIGSIQKGTDPNGVYGNAEINFIVKGDKKFKDVTTYVTKYVDTPEWQVEGIE